MTQTILAFQPPDPQVTIRPVRLGDLSSLQHNCWPQRDPDWIYHFVLRIRENARAGRGHGAVIVDDEDAVLGYGQFMLWPRCGEISDLFIAPGYRDQGLGTALIQYLVRVAHDMNAACVDIGAARSNPRALALYRRLGFRDSYTQRLNLGDGEEEVVYLRIKFRRRK
jgi:ribosomal protein S18 acetylase RimI-like enzyme